MQGGTDRGLRPVSAGRSFYTQEGGDPKMDGKQTPPAGIHSSSQVMNVQAGNPIQIPLKTPKR